MSDNSSSTGEPRTDDAPAAPAAPGVPTPEAYVIPADLAQATLNYLAAQPYREVFALVKGFESLEPLPPRS